VDKTSIECIEPRRSYIDIPTSYKAKQSKGISHAHHPAKKTTSLSQSGAEVTDLQRIGAGLYTAREEGCFCIFSISSRPSDLLCRPASRVETPVSFAGDARCVCSVTRSRHLQAVPPMRAQFLACSVDYLGKVSSAANSLACEDDDQDRLWGRFETSILWRRLRDRSTYVPSYILLISST